MIAVLIIGVVVLACVIAYRLTASRPLARVCQHCAFYDAESGWCRRHFTGVQPTDRCAGYRRRP